MTAEKIRNHVVKWLIVLVIIVVNIMRKPQLLIQPRFYAEEGQAFFSFAYNHTLLQYILHPMFGYYALYNVIATSVATLFDLETAPLVTTFQALFIQVAVSFYVIRADIPILNSNVKRYIVAFSLPLICPVQIWLTTIGVQYWLCILTALILLETPASRLERSHAVKAGILIITGLSGILSCMMTPVFLLKWFNSKAKQFILYFWVLGACSAIQLVIFLNAYLGHDSGLSRRLTRPAALTGNLFTDNRFFKPMTAADTIYSHTLHLLGELFITSETINLHILKTIDISVNRLVFHFTHKFIFVNYEVIYLLLSALIVASIITVTLNYKKNMDFICIMLSIAIIYSLSVKLSLSGIGGPRYMFAPQALVIIFLVASIDKIRLNIAGMILISTCLALIITSHILDYAPSMVRVYNDQWPKWGDEVRLWRTGSDQPLNIWPPPWQMSLDKNAR
jgi:hypothetical protein